MIGWRVPDFPQQRACLGVFITDLSVQPYNVINSSSVCNNTYGIGSEELLGQSDIKWQRCYVCTRTKCSSLHYGATQATAPPCYSQKNFCGLIGHRG